MAGESGGGGGSEAPRRKRDPRDKRIEKLQRENAKLNEDLARTTRDRDRWKRRSENLKKQLDEARRAGKRQAAPFAKDRPQGSGKPPGRRPGAQYGRQGSRRCPPKVDEPAYRELCRQVRNAPVVTPDETGWRVGAQPSWLWTFVTPETTVYAICPGRGFDDAATVLGTDYAGVLVRDGWQVYRRYKGLHQTCINHLLQRCTELQRKHPYSLWGPKVKAVLQAGLDVRDRCRNGELTRHGLDSLRGRLEARLGRLIDAPPPLKDAKRFAKHLANEFPAVFLFLRDPSIDATNWRAEQAIRPAVVIRKVCGGNRTRKGADTQQVLSTVVRTVRQRGLDLPTLTAEMLRAPELATPEAFGLPPPPA